MNKNKESIKQTQSHSSNTNKELQKLVQNNNHFEFLPTGKIKCLITNHEILPTIQEFQQYINGKSYKNAVENDIDFTQFEPYIVQHKSDNHKLFCNLTRQNISKKKSVVLKHVNGKRYKYYLQKYLDEKAKEEEEINQENQKEEIDEFEDMNNLINEEDSQQQQQQQQQQQEQNKKQKQGILKKGKKISKQQNNKQKQQINQNEQKQQKNEKQKEKSNEQLNEKQNQKQNVQNNKKELKTNQKKQKKQKNE